MNGSRVRLLCVCAVVVLFTVSVAPPQPALALANPCALDPGNLIVNGSLAAGTTTPYGVVALNWSPFVLSPSAPTFEHVTNEQLDPNGAQSLWSEGTVFDAGIYQTVANLTPGRTYRVSLGYALAAHDPGTGQNTRTNLIGRELGIDFTGGIDPRASTVQWNPVVFNGQVAVNIPELSFAFAAQTDRLTIFLRSINTDTSGRNKVWFDAVCMEPLNPPSAFAPAPTSPICVPTNVATIAVSARPKAIAVDPTTHRAFVALFDSSAVAVLDTTRNQMLATWNTDGGGNANGIAFANGRVLVSKRNNVRLSVLDAANGSLLSNITVGRLPYGVGALGTRAWVANFQDNSVSTIDATTNRVLSTQNIGVYPALVAPFEDHAYVSFWGGGVAILGLDGAIRGKISLDPGAFGVAIDPVHRRLIVANRGTNKLSLIDAATNATLQTVTETGTPFAIAVNPATNHLFIVLAQSNLVRVRDATTFALIADVPVGVQGNDGGDGIAIVDNQVYISNFAASSISVISDACATSTPTPTLPPPPTPPPLAPSPTPTTVGQCTPTVVRTIAVNGRPKGIGVDPANARAFAALFDTSAVAVLDTNMWQNLATWATNSAGHANAVAVSDNRLVVSLRDAASVAILDARTGAFIAQRATGGMPYGVAAANGKTWVANFGAGSVSVVDAATLAVTTLGGVGANPALVAAMADRAFLSLWGGGVGIVGADGLSRGRLALEAGTFGVAVNAATNRLYATNRRTNTLSLLNLDTNASAQTVREPSPPFALALNPATNHLFIVLPATNTVRVRDATTLALLADVRVGAQGNDGGDGIAVVNNRVFVSNYDARSISVIEDACAGTPAPVPTNAPPATPSRTAVPGAILIREELAILNAYPYDQFWSDAFDATYNFTYKKFDWGKYGAASRSPVIKTFKTLVLENEYLRLTFLPEIGGRLWQVLYKPTNQTVFYQNRWLKPTTWGPAQQQGWLGVGGMEWALPVDEHGYAWGVPWSYTLERAADRATITLSDPQANARVRAQVAVTLPANAAYFVVRPRIENVAPTATRLQFWLNAQIALNQKNVSAQTEFYLPATQVFVHSTQDAAIPAANVPPANVTAPVSPLSWPLVGNRNLAQYAAWRDYLGVFVTTPLAGLVGAYDRATELGIARLFPPERAPGVKLFGWGANSPLRAIWTDDGSDYFELWGGLPRTFFRDDDVTLAAGEAREWEETWVPFVRTGGLQGAGQHAILGLTVANNRATVGVAVTTPNTRGTLLLLRDGAETRRWSLALDPGNTFREQLDVANGGAYRLRFVAEDGNVIAETR